MHESAARVQYNTRPAIGSSSATASNNNRSDPSDGSSDSLVEQTGEESRSAESVHLSIGRGNAIGHHQQHRLQQDHSGSPPIKSRHLAVRVLDPTGHTIGQFTGATVIMQTVPLTTNSQLFVTPSEYAIDIEAEYQVQQPVHFNELTSLDWKNYLAYLHEYLM